jgi:microcin C transport system substrate-binding protein
MFGPLPRMQRSFAAAVLLSLAAVSPALAQAPEPTRHHALSLVGTPKFPADFKHFDWVNPDAPKGGVARLWVLGSFDSLNPFSIQGRPASGLNVLTSLIYAPLMVDSPDEPSTEYCLVCEWVSYPADFSSATFRLREGMRFHDGQPITADDVVFSLTAIKKAHPQAAAYYKNVVAVEKTGERDVTFRFDQTGNRELPTIIGQLQILPKHFWEAKGASGEPRDLAKSTLEVPVGSGAYRIKSVDAGKVVAYERVADWWAKDLPVTRGQWNFGELRFTYFLDKTPAFEGFKVGQIDFWRESSAKDWSTRYDFDAVKKGLVKKDDIAISTLTPMQGFFFNLRRKQFQDPRVRQAFALAFDFEFANQNLFFGLYKRVDGYFGNSELAATGLPQGRELEILKEFEKELPSEVFTSVWKNPVAGSPEALRRNLSMAAKLLAEAGYTVKNGVLTNAKGEQLTAEFLEYQPDLERVVLPYKANLEKLGVKASLRIVDTSQYKRRLTTFDYDIVSDVVAQSQSPGNEQRDFWGSAAADVAGSNNTSGLKSAAIDKIIEKIVFAKDRAELVAATRALDRVLLWSHIAVPQWHRPGDWIATWSMFGRPAKLPSQATSFQRVWWLDEAAAAKLGPGRGK